MQRISKVLKILFNFFLWGTAKLPEKIRINFGKLLGLVAYIILVDLRNVVKKNLQYTNLCKEECCKCLVRKTFLELGVAFAQLGTLWLWAPEKTLKLISEVQGLEKVNAAMSQNKGVILFTGHFGSWEILNQYLAVKWPISIIYRKINNVVIDGLIKKYRSRTGSLLIEKKSAIRPLIKSIKDGKMVGILTDQNVDIHEGVFSPFFGKQASTSPLLARLARVRGSPIFGVFAVRTNGDRDVVIKFIQLKYDSENIDEKLLIDIQNKILEDEIRKSPEQYWWFHKRFKAVINGGDSPY